MKGQYIGQYVLSKTVLYQHYFNWLQCLCDIFGPHSIPTQNGRGNLDNTKI